jgi:hypothetical protein
LTIIHGGDVGIEYGEISAPDGFMVLKLGMMSRPKVEIALGLASKIALYLG